MDAIRAKLVSKKFRRAGMTTFKTYFLRDMWKGSDPGVVWALKDVDLSVEKGATFGIIGQNGSGKSTLLKILAGILRPDSGEVEVNGKVSALIELGAGFHPEFTGRENIFINGMLLGLTKEEIRRKLDSIIDFSGLKDFIDEPVRTYSSGMYSKLGFSVAVNVDPDVLLIDEVFAVGDEEFTHKCKAKMDEFKRRGKTILFVTHSLSTVEQWCDSAMWIEYGVVRATGKSMDITNAYRQEIFEIESRSLTKQSESANGNLGGGAVEGRDESGAEAGAESASKGKRWGSREVEITSVKLFDSEGKERCIYRTGEEVRIRIDFRAVKTVSNPVFGIAMLRGDGVWCYGTNTEIDDIKAGELEGEGALTIVMENVSLLGGQYFIDAAVQSSDGPVYDYIRQAQQLNIRSDKDEVGLLRLGHRWELSSGASPAKENIIQPGVHHERKYGGPA